MINLEKKSDKKAARKTAAPKVGFNKPMGVTATVQYGGNEWPLDELREKAMAMLQADPDLSESGAKVYSIALYIKPEEGMAYYTANTTKGEAGGCFELG